MTWRAPDDLFFWRSVTSRMLKNGMSGESYRVVIIMSYTAMFHAAQAILYRDGVRERSHECIPLYIRERYPALDKHANKLDSYRKSRHAAMYGLEFEPGRQDAITSLAVAREFLSAMENALDSK